MNINLWRQIQIGEKILSIEGSIKLQGLKLRNKGSRFYKEQIANSDKNMQRSETLKKLFYIDFSAIIPQNKKKN